MAGFIGARASVVSSGAERKQTYAITTTTTSLTGLAYTPTKVHVFHNGIRLVDGTDYTATDGSTITLINAAEDGDEVVVISYATFQTSDTVSAANGGTFAGNVAVTGTLDVADSLSIEEVIEKVTPQTSTTGTINFDCLTQAIENYSADQTANRTINFRGDASTTLDSVMATDESMTFSIIMKQGTTAYYLNAYQIDGSTITPKWSGGSAPSAGNASSLDIYTFTIIKTASATFTVLASLTQYA